MLALLTGALIGLVRGGRPRALTSVRLLSPGWLVAGVSAVLVVSWIGPAYPLVWMLGAYLAFARFGLRNLHLTGMIVLLIGMLMNASAMIANGAVPVSERALLSVEQVTTDGQALIEGLRESNSTATSFAVFGDIVPVPVLNVVVSLGDLVIAVALADIMMNVFLRARTRELDEGGVSFASDANLPEPETLREPVLTPRILPPGALRLRERPAHAAKHRRLRLAKLHTIHVPAHAAPKQAAASSKEPAISNEGPTEAPSVVSPQPTVARPAPTQTTEPVLVLADDPQGSAYFEPPAIDNRPIIDLTVSPTDEQLCEFLRRRADADRALLENAEQAPHPRRRQRRRIRRTEVATVDA